MLTAALIITATIAAGIRADDRATDAFVKALRQAVARDDRAAVARLIDFPITVFVGSLRMPIENAAALAERYDLVFTSELKAALARERPASTEDGFVIGGVTVRSTASGLKIAKIVVSPPSMIPAPPTAPARSAPPRRPTNEASRPRRIIVRGGGSPAEVAGIVERGATQSYVVWVPTNQLLQVRIDGVRGRDVVAHVRDAKNGAPLDARAHDGVRSWSGRVPATGDYRIDVSSTPSATDSVGYRLVVTVR